MNKEFLKSVMDQTITRKITICGSMSKHELMIDKYNAYLTLRNNIVQTPVKYSLIKTDKNDYDKDLKILKDIHFKKILESNAILVVCDSDMRIGANTTDELNYAYDIGKYVLFTNVPENIKECCEINNDLNFPLYIFKEVI